MNQLINKEKQWDQVSTSGLMPHNLSHKISTICIASEAILNLIYTN